MNARLLALLLLPALAAPLEAGALESAVVSSPRAQASLISESDTFTPGQPLRVGLRLRMAPGWYTYWQNPGDAGAATEMAFVLPEGVAAGPIAWPAPERHVTGPVVSFGYENEVVLPVTLQVGQAVGGTLPVTVQATWLVCEKICVPEEGEFTLALPQGPAAPSAEAGLFAAADARVPRPSPWAATVSTEGVLSLAGLDGTRVKEAWFAPFAWGQVDHSAAQPLTAGTEGMTLALRPGPEFRHEAGLKGVVIVTDRGGQVSALEVAAAPGAALAMGGAAMLPLWQLLLFALAAGAILNLMPCVFPVLALKAMGLARVSGQGRRVAVEQAGAYAAGVVTTFLALAGALVALRAAGAAVGWGFQFQSPVFVAAMAWLLFAIGLNMSGLFQVGGGAAAQMGDEMCRRGGAVGSFFTGLLAVLVATPCTAPFMGAAIAGALVAPLAVTLLGFLAMGIGFALPFVLLAVVPALARRLPRPGPWMDILRQAMAFPMYGAAIWLLWVVSVQAGPTGVLYTAGGMLLIGFALWAVGLAQSHAGAARKLAAGAAVAAGAAALAVLSTLATSPPAAAGIAAGEEGAYEPYSPERLAALRAEGKPVFVNMTAAWCVTCLVNEQVALNRPAVREGFQRAGVTYLKGDWTRRDPAISDYLRVQGRDGVPLYVFYPPGGGAPRVLPQILPEQRVLDEVARPGT